MIYDYSSITHAGLFYKVISFNVLMSKIAVNIIHYYYNL